MGGGRTLQHSFDFLHIFFPYYEVFSLRSFLNVKHFFFDLDGTLVYTDAVNNAAYRKAVKKILGVDIDGVKGRITRETVKELFPHISDKDLERIIREKRKLYRKYADFLVLNEDVVRFIKFIREFNSYAKIYIVSDAEKERGVFTLEYFGISELFDGYFFKEDKVFGNKYENALKILGVSPSKVAVFEDDPSKVYEAIRAGIRETQIYIVNFNF